MEIWGRTDNGKVRHQNEDTFRTFVDEFRNVAVLVVCDGMGGAKAGEVASAIAAETFMAGLSDRIAELKDPNAVSDAMTSAVLTANRAVFDESIRDESRAGMGTTLTALTSTSAGEIVVNIGDSRAYHITLSAITQITKDHSVVEDMIAKGDITRAQARKHPNKHLITRALGTAEDDAPDIFFLNLYRGDYVLLCSDGLSNTVMDSEMLFQLQSGVSVRDSCEKLVEIALSRGAPDNVTAVLFRK